MKILAACLMVKNEEKRIEVSLDSVKNIVDKIIILDTGSTDETLNKIKTWSSKNKIPYHIRLTKFTDFSTTRNELLNFIDYKDGGKSDDLSNCDKKQSSPLCDYCLLMDSNDELKDGTVIRKFVDSFTGQQSGFNIQQVWKVRNELNKYYNVRLIKSGHGWRYRSRVHEYITSDEAKFGVAKIPEAYLYQDRVFDDDKTFPRFPRDKEMLYQDYLDEKDRGEKSSRTFNYLAQTCLCMGQAEEAFKYSLMRTKLSDFKEEVYQSYFRLGNCSIILNHSYRESINWFLEAYDYSSKIFSSPRVEPLISIAKLLDVNDKYQEAYTHLKRSLELPYPDDAVLYVDSRMYEYTRFILFAKIADKINDLSRRDTVLKILSDKKLLTEEDKKWIEEKKIKI